MSHKRSERSEKPDWLLEALKSLRPPEKLTVSQWAEKNRILGITSAQPGQWRNSLTPFLIGVMDAFNDPEIEEEWFCKPTQVGGTEAALNMVGYIIEQDPGPTMIVCPTEAFAKYYSKNRLQPMIQLCPGLRAKYIERDSEDLELHFTDMHLYITWADSPSALAGRPIRYLFFEEVDKFPKLSGKEAGPIGLAKERTGTFPHNRKIVGSSTPTLETGNVWSAQENANEILHYYVPCPKCGCYQALKFKPNLKWPQGSTADQAYGAAWYECEECESHLSDADKSAMISKGQWEVVQRNGSSRRKVWMWLNTLVSPWKRFGDIAREFIDSKDDYTLLQNFTNSWLAEPWEDKSGESIDQEILSARQHYYNCDVPAETQFITAGVDVQKDRLELEVAGWGAGEESWGIQYVLIPGDPWRSEVWDQLDEFLQTTYRRSDGVVLPIGCTAVDSGYATSAVYMFCKKRLARYIFAIKGQGGPGLPVVSAFRRQGKNKDCPVFPVGVDSAKDLLFTRLMIENEGPGYCHFPQEKILMSGDMRGYNQDYFQGLLTEHRVEKKVNGRIVHTWVKNSSRSRNEPLDCRVYATAALKIRNPDLKKAAKDTSTVDASGKVTAPVNNCAVNNNAVKPKRRRQVNRGIDI